MDADLTYYRRRALDETAAATAATDAMACRIHLELARRYGERCAAIEAARLGGAERLLPAA
ncbi:MAG TPA: hypothetical protein VNR86_03100 [Sphingomicrobium sp.]|nr:hypothetical protein [Sphingomicrobium sp.]